MASPSSTSRRNTAARNLSCNSSRGDLLGPPIPSQLVQPGTNSSSSSGAQRALHERRDEHKENNTENGNGRAIHGRSSQNPRGVSKKPWVVHFSKSAGALSPSNRILVDRNSSCSPVRSPAGIWGNGEGFGDHKVRITPPKEREEAITAQGPVKGVAELSKRIQQFLEEQDVLLGVKTGKSQEVAPSSASVTPEAGQHSSVSPYNPYKSPFSERPQFLRLNGNASTMDRVDVVSVSTEAAGAAMEETTEELPLFEGHQVLATPLQQIQFSTNLSPLSTEDEEMTHGGKSGEQLSRTTLEQASGDALMARIKPILESEKDSLQEAHGGNSGEQFSEATLGDASRDALMARINPTSENEKDCLQEFNANNSQGIIISCPTEPLSKKQEGENSQNQARGGDMEVQSSKLVEEAVLAEGKDLSQSGNMASWSQTGNMKTPQTQNDEAGQPENESQHPEMESQSLEGDLKSPEGKEHSVVKTEDHSQLGEMQTGHYSDSCLIVEDDTVMPVSVQSDEMEDLQEEVRWGKVLGRVIFRGVLLAAFVTLTLLACAGPGLLPSSLVDNPVHSFWHSSNYHKQSMMFISGMEGLWSTENAYLHADVRGPVGRGVEMLHSIRRLSIEARKELEIFVQVTSSILDDWWKVLVQHSPLSKNPNPDVEGERGHQFEWIQNFEFEEEWFEEMPTLAYTDWELLHEYDLGAANDFILGSIPEVLKDDLRRNFSRLSDSSEVKGVLEDLMKLKGGNTEEDRLEVLQYFWEYTRFSASAHETIMKFQDRQTGVEEASTTLGTSSDHPSVGPSDEQSKGEPGFFIPATDEPHSDIPLTDGSVAIGLPGSDEQNEQSRGGHVSSIPHSDDLHSDILLTDGFDAVGLDSTSAPLDMQQDLEAEDDKLSEQHLDEEAEPSVAVPSAEVVIKKELSGVALEMTAEKLQESSKNLASDVLIMNQNAVASADEKQNGLSNTLIQEEIRPTEKFKFGIVHVVAALATLSVVMSVLGLARLRVFKDTARLASPLSTSVQFLRKSDQLQEKENLNSFADASKTRKEITMIEELSTFAPVLQSPVPNWSRLQGLQQARTTHHEELGNSPVPASTAASSPYGSFTTFKLLAKKEGQAGETKLTPVRRSNRIRNHSGMSPKVDAVKRVAISPP